MAFLSQESLEKTPYSTQVASYLKVVSVATAARRVNACSDTLIPSVWARMCKIWMTSSDEYGSVRMIITRSSKSNGMPWDDTISSVPLKWKK